MQSMTGPHDAIRHADEERLVCIMFCDLVDSGVLAMKLPSERYTDMLSGFIEACQAAIARFEGLVVERRGDGLLVYFGLPSAHENDGIRAVRAGLAMIDQVTALGKRLGISLRVRIGIHTGTVRVGRFDPRNTWECASGSNVSIAFRLQEIADPGTVIVSDATLALIRDYFTFEDMGTHELRNMSSIGVFRILGESGISNRLDALSEGQLTPLVGREDERERLLALWRRAKEGAPQFVEINGEPGVGKSRLVRTIARESENTVVFRCSELNQHSALFPVISRLRRLLDLDQVDAVGQLGDLLHDRLREEGFAPEVLPLLVAELSNSADESYSLRNVPQSRRQQMLLALVDWHLDRAETQPTMAVWEDLHWADPSTLELIGKLIERASVRQTPLLTLLTFRPDFHPPWPDSPALTTVRLGRLKPPVVREMIGRIAHGRDLPPKTVEHIVEMADGVPLYIEELVGATTSPDRVSAGDGGGVRAPMPLSISIPAKLGGFLTSRLDRTGAEARVLAQRASVLGRSFPEDVLRALVERDAIERNPREAWNAAEQCLWQLERAGLIRARRARQVTYTFRHALLHQAAYDLLLPRIRRAYHRETAEVLKARFPATVAAQPELLAHHYTIAALGREGERQHLQPGEIDSETLGKAVDGWLEAGARARDRSANREAIRHCDEGLRALQYLPETADKERRELSLRVASITPMIAVEGYVADAIARTAERALALCRKLDDPEHLFPVMYVLWVNRFVAARYGDALDLSDEFECEARGKASEAARLMAHRIQGFSLLMIGQLARAEQHLRDALRIYDPLQHGELKNKGFGQDPRCACEAFMALTLWLRGHAGEAADWSRMAIEHGRYARHTNTWGYVLCFGAATYEAIRGNSFETERYASELLAFAEKEGLPVWLAYARVLRGWALAVNEGSGAGLAQMRAGLVDFEDGGSGNDPAKSLNMRFMKSLLLCLFADAYGRMGRPEEGLVQIGHAWSFALSSGEAFWRSQVLRLKGELLLQADAGAGGALREEVETSFLNARETAAAQGAWSLELRAAVSLAQFWRADKPTQARSVLESVVAMAPHGSGSEELHGARLLLGEVASLPGGAV